jgi:hypothetical protein
MEPPLVADPSVFFIFSTEHSFYSILSSRTFDAFAFAPRQKAKPSATTKEPNLPLL